MLPSFLGISGEWPTNEGEEVLSSAERMCMTNEGEVEELGRRNTEHSSANVRY